MPLPGFQVSGFQNTAFQAGVPLVASDYAVGSPSFSTPAIGESYHLAASPYSVGSPSFAAPPITIIGYGLHPTPVTVGSPSFGTPTVRSAQKLLAQSYVVASPVFDRPAAFNQVANLFANAYSVGGPTFEAPLFIHNYQLDPVAFDLGNPVFAPPNPPIVVGDVLAATDYFLPGPRFPFPYLTVSSPPPAVPLPPMYADVADQAMAQLNQIISLLLASIPDNTSVGAFNARLAIDDLRANMQDSIASSTLGTDLGNCFSLSITAGATYSGLETLRQYVMSQVTSVNGYVQNMLRSALAMTLAAECQAIQQLTFTSQNDAVNVMTVITGAFEQAKLANIDDYDSGIYQAVTALSGTIVRYLAQEELQLPKMVTYNVAAPMPSLYLAQLIYQDASRADEISDENGVINPMFCPTSLQVLSDFDA
jgi:hypothetical protein